MKNPQNELILSCADLRGWDIRTPNAETVGEVKDIVVNTSTGEVAYLVLKVNTGFLNMESKYFAIPWEVLSFDNAQDRVLVFDINKNRLENSPGFDKDNWPTGPQTEFITQMNTYYGVTKRHHDSDYHDEHYRDQDRDFNRGQERGGY